jgi:predicted nucleotidyltransferase
MEPMSVETLAKQCGATWPAIKEARAKAREQIELVRKELAKLYDPQVSVVVTGSVGRGEVTGGSDFDWMLLVDGASDAAHFTLAGAILTALDKLGIKAPVQLKYLANSSVVTISSTTSPELRIRTRT